MPTREEQRLLEAARRTANWKRWGPYLSERSWGTVREDYSPDGAAWEYFPHDHARSRAYRWGEDGIAGICDRHQILCFAVALWNGRDPIVKERLFGLSGKEGNHGEDVKELYYYLDSTPTHSYMKFLYKYPQAEFPYAQLASESRRRGRSGKEPELIETGVFDQDRYFDVFVEYAKAGVEDICVRIEVANRGPEEAALELLPTLWFRNTWSWDARQLRPRIRAETGGAVAEHPREGPFHLACEGEPELLFCDNESNLERLWDVPGPRYPKDGINDHLVHGRDSVNPARIGTRMSARYSLRVPARGSRLVRLRLCRGAVHPVDGDDAILAARKQEADEFYATVIPAPLSPDAKNVMRQALAGMLWSKQFYHYVVRDWLRGDPAQPPPPEERKRGRNADWTHLYGSDVLSMPDKWEYPWFASWDLAFHCIPLSLVDADFAKEQLVLLLREWYMHPNGQIPAYEWAFGDANPPVLAWAAWRVYKIERKRRGAGDRKFLKRVFLKLMLNFTWWVNRKDAGGRNVFQGGFLGLDNIGVFDRSRPLPGGGSLEQSDATSWMAMYCLNMLTIALELAREEEVFEDVASKFWEHFVHIAQAINTLGLWDAEDAFFYDVLQREGRQEVRLRIRSMVGLIPLFAVEPIAAEIIASFPAFSRRLEWFIDNRPDLTQGVANMRTRGPKGHRLFSVVGPDKLRAILKRVLDEKEFLSPHGVRALSRVHADHPYVLRLDGHEYGVRYEPAESSSGLFGGNSNWRGPVWFPLNYLLIESLQKFHHYLGDGFTVEFPTGSGRRLTLAQVAAELSRRLSSLFLLDDDGRRPAFGAVKKFQEDPHFSDALLFHEYFDGDDGTGLGAIHQTGWTGLVAKLLQQSGE
ncbi:MAG TPA: glucosidase [Myxococcales bacterium]|nr:glucosidase [Myxococcales bacterium]